MGKKLISVVIALFIVILVGSNLANSKVKFYGNTAIVAQSGGDYTDPVTAMSDYEVWCGTPSASNPCLMQIMPGIYDIGSSSVVMQDYIDIEGSGENITKILGNTGTAGVVIGATNAELRFLSVENKGGSSNAIAIHYENESPKILHVTAKAWGGTAMNCGVYLQNPGSSPLLTITHVTATASGGPGTTNYGIWYVDCKPTLRNVIATASGSTDSYGVFDNNDTGGSSTIENSVISGDTGSILSDGFGSAKVASTRLVGDVFNDPGNPDPDPAPICAGVWDKLFNFYPDCCPGLPCD